MQILIAEDDHTSRTVLSAVLKKSGYEVLQTSDGAEAWRVLQQPDSPRLAILDWLMPGMEGLEVVRQMRTLPTERQPYLIMLTAKGEKADIIAGLDAGANDYLSKPFDLGELQARVEVGRRMIEMQEALIRSREILAHQATHDPLTGMLNRRAILDHLHRELARIERHGDILAVGMCDIDHFKHFNDTYGHQTGDDVLCGLTQIFNEICRDYDSVGRMGGEEFLVITPIKEGVSPASVFDRLCLQIAEKRIPTRSGELSISMSIGVACAAPGSTVDGILGIADAALYRAKNQGGNQTVYASQCVEKGESDQPAEPSE
jgi:diguanylate cyclase (GGDEF)-like protein